MIFFLDDAGLFFLIIFNPPVFLNLEKVVF
jgi:hypothetical protein